MSYKILKFIFWFTIVNNCLVGFGQVNNENIGGYWRCEIKTDGGQLPFELFFNFNMSNVVQSHYTYAINGKEKLKLDKPFLKNDSLHIPIDMYDAEIVAKVDQGKMNGYWHRFIGGTKHIYSPFSAKFGHFERFKKLSTQKPVNINGKWTTTFTTVDGKNVTEAVGVFNQTGSKVTGTFLTTTGDYRFLEGIVDGDSLKMSTFDGTHLYLFLAKKTGNTLNGQFWYNIHSLENWTATLDPNAQLPDLNKLTYLKPGYSKFDFAFPDTEGKIISLDKYSFDNKVKIIQIMGSWCPNCMDESKYLAPWYIKNKNRGIEIFGLAYEKSTDLAISGPKIDKMKERFGIKYPVLLAGSKDAGEAAKSLPMLNNVLGFPTTIIIDKKGVVRQIHTGFSGPGTGKYYNDWIKEFNLIIDKLLVEK